MVGEHERARVSEGEPAHLALLRGSLSSREPKGEGGKAFYVLNRQACRLTRIFGDRAGKSGSQHGFIFVIPLMTSFQVVDCLVCNVRY
jgi:hypothetical protein